MKKPIITVDIETYSPQDIAKVGAYRYAQDPDFQILLFGFAIGDEDAPDVIDLTDLPDPGAVLRMQPWLLDDRYTKRAHNAAFEWWCLSEVMGLSGLMGLGDAKAARKADHDRQIEAVRRRA